MTSALLITLASVALGALLAFVTSRGNTLLGALRTFAVVAVLVGVAAQLLPEAVEALGGAALVVFAGALALPSVIAFAFRRQGARRSLTARGLGIELGYVGFVAHQFAEGLALGTYVGPQHLDHDHADLVLAMAAHTVPLTCVFIAAALAARGRPPAFRRTAALLVATALGFAAAGWVHGGLTDAVHPWLSAAVAGFLCHVLLHPAGKRPARTLRVRVLDVIAFVAGVVLPLQAGHTHGHGDELRHRVGDAFVELVMETAPMLLLGLVLGAGLQLLGARIPGRWLTTGSATRQAVRGIAIGAPLPLCACGVLPIAESLRTRGAGPALVMAFLVATPELGPETLTLGVRFLGWPFAIVRLAAALLLALVAGVAFAHAIGSARARTGAATEAGKSMVMGDVPGRGRLGSALAHFDELLLHTAPWTVVGLLAAAYIEAVIPVDSLAPLAESGLDLLVVAVIAMPTYVCAASATPLAAVLLLKGISPGAVLVGLLLGPATNVATVAVLSRGWGARPVLAVAGTIFFASCIMGWLVNVAGVPVHAPSELLLHPEHGVMALASVVVLGGFLLVQLWRAGAQPWLDILDAGAHAHDHAGAHEGVAEDDHAHDHAGHHH